AILQELIERRGRFLALESVDRVGVIARDDEQPLNAGKPRLRGIVLGLFAEIGGEALLGLRWLDLREPHQPLGRAAVAGLGRRDDEVAFGDAEIRVARLRQRRGAVGGQRTGVQIDLVGRDRALQHATARAGVHAEPAARRGGALLLEREREIEHVARLVAELQVGARGQREPHDGSHCQEEARSHLTPRIARCSIDESDWWRRQDVSLTQLSSRASEASPGIHRAIRAIRGSWVPARARGARLAGMTAAVWVRPTLTYLCISVPAPASVSNSISTACSTLPSTITTPSTPASSAYMQVSTFGIMPPEMVPSAIRRRASSTESSLISCLDLSSTPGTSVSSSRRFAFRAPAIAPAKVSALTL